MTQRVIRDRLNTTTLLISLLVVLAIAGGYLAGQGYFNSERLIILAGAIVILILFSRTDDIQLRTGLWFAVALFAVGHRGIYVSRWTFFVPAELIIWGIYFLLILRATTQHRLRLGKIPLPVVFLVIWAIMGLFRSSILGLSTWDAMISQVKLWIFCLPVFVIVSTLVTKESHLKRANQILIWVAIYMSMQAIIERYLPQFTGLFPGFYQIERLIIVTADGFSRTTLSFWGNPVGVILIGWGALMLTHKFIWANSLRTRAFVVGGLLICIIAIYIAGQRSTWIAYGLGVLFIVATSGRRGVLLSPLILAVLMVIPSAGWERLETLDIRDQPVYLVDSSLTYRIQRWTEAIEAIADNPIFGTGPGGRLVHNEFLTFGARLGLPAMFAFAILLFSIIGYIYRIYRQSTDENIRRSGQLYLALSLTWLVDISVRTAFSNVPTAIPYWFMVALVWQASRIYHLPREKRSFT